MVCGLTAVLATQTVGQAPVITSFHENGRVSWTNAVNTNAIYRMEWASRLDGVWHSFTYQSINTIDAHGSTEFEIEVPMFYRVVMVTNQPPPGMVWIDGGDVELGENGQGGNPLRTNFVSGFWMDEMEVTKAKWDDVYKWATNNGYALDNPGYGKTNNHPVTTVNWYDCVKWCNARSQKEGLTPCYYTDATFIGLYTNGQVNVSTNCVNWSANGYRLPTDAEWEKAARGGRWNRLFPWGGDTISHNQANYNSSNYTSLTNYYVYDVSPTQGYHPVYNDGIRPFTSPVGSFPANGYGLHDMAGNVYEWVWDRTDSQFSGYSSAYQVDPRGFDSGNYRMGRGGSWYYNALVCRCAWHPMLDPPNNYGSWPYAEGGDVGFRCARGR